MSLQIIILAAGKGTRMCSNLPKVLHPLAGTPLLQHVLNTAAHLNPQNIHIIIGHQAALIQSSFEKNTVNWIVQKNQLGTGHAVMQALPFLKEEDDVLILSGDVPLITLATLDGLKQQFNDNETLALLTARLPNPHGFGRIIRHNGRVQGIVEEKDATLDEKNITEINTGIYWASAKHLMKWLPMINNDNAQSEFYLTDIVGLALKEGLTINTHSTEDLIEIQGINDRLQLAALERAYQLKQAQSLMTQGVTLMDPNRLDIRGRLTAGIDVTIDINAVFIGEVHLDAGVIIGPNCVIKNTTIGAGTEIYAHSVIDGATIGKTCQIGPYARIRPNTILKDKCKIGNFVETKNASFDTHSKASHLSYLGDVTIGQDVNIGAGTITCNYDGVNKHQTIIEDGVFIGSDTQLVAPVRVGKNATLGAGTTLRKDAPAGELTLTESRQKTLSGWKRPEKIK